MGLDSIIIAQVLTQCRLVFMVKYTAKGIQRHTGVLNSILLPSDTNGGGVGRKWVENGFLAFLKWGGGGEQRAYWLGTLPSTKITATHRPEVTGARQRGACVFSVIQGGCATDRTCARSCHRQERGGWLG